MLFIAINVRRFYYLCFIADAVRISKELAPVASIKARFCFWRGWACVGAAVADGVFIRLSQCDLGAKRDARIGEPLVVEVRR